MRRGDTLVVVFAKAPVAGRAKTRLRPLLGAEGAARLHARLVERTVAVALRSGCGPVELHGAPSHHMFLRSLARRHGIALRAQSEGDVGVRMLSAFRRGLRSHARVLLIGSDCPALGSRDLRDAARLLRSCDAVLAPAEDGGYPLLGLSRVSERVFGDIAWSTDAVLAQTRLRLRELGWRSRELRTVWDVDRPEDVARLAASRLMERRP